jgi:hypothetical protein
MVPGTEILNTRKNLAWDKEYKYFTSLTHLAAFKIKFCFDQHEQSRI